MFHGPSLLLAWKREGKEVIFSMILPLMFLMQFLPGEGTMDSLSK